MKPLMTRNGDDWEFEKEVLQYSITVISKCHMDWCDHDGIE